VVDSRITGGRMLYDVYILCTISLVLGPIKFNFKLPKKYM